MDSITDLARLTWPDEATAAPDGLLTELWAGTRRSLQRHAAEPVDQRRTRSGARSDMKIVYTPLHGAGNKPVRRILR